MGSSSSRLGSRPSRTRVNRNNRFTLSSLLICGGRSSSPAPLQMDNCPPAIMGNCAEHCNPVISQVQNPIEVSSLTLYTSASSTVETRSSIQGGVVASDDTSSQESSRNVETSSRGKCLCESKGLLAPNQVSVDYSHHDSYNDRTSSAASTSFKEQPSDPVSVNNSANKDAVNGIDNSENKVVPQICTDGIRSSSSSPQGPADSNSNGVLVENHVGDVAVIHNPQSEPVTHISDVPLAFHAHEDESVEETIPPGLGFLVSNREQSQEDGSVLHVDVVSISSSILSSSNADTNNREARRNSRRLFWDAFSRRSSRRHGDPPTFVFSTDDADDLGSHDRWLLDFSGDFFDDGVGGDSGYLGSRIRSLNERRRHSRSEIWERLRGGLDDNGRRTAFCQSGLHPDGTCSCESFLMTEESSTRASISRIVMLAEALFEVLDEIHRQPLSLSLSMVSLPAPDSVVDSFPLKSHKKANTSEGKDGVEQCYICLAEYEEGDQIRVLPCHHEYHMSCVDKWLKEIHGVCPLCRGDVRQGATECSVSNSEIPSL